MNILTHIGGNIYIGSSLDVETLDSPMSPKIDLVVNVAKEIDILDNAPTGIWYIKFGLIDKNVEQTRYIIDACETIREGILNGEKVMVHCNAGISRSSIVCISTLHLMGLSWEEAERIVRERHKPAYLMNNELLNTTKKYWDITYKKRVGSG